MQQHLTTMLMRGMSRQAKYTASFLLQLGSSTAERPNTVRIGTGRKAHAKYGRLSCGVAISCVSDRTYPNIEKCMSVCSLTNTSITRTAT